MTTPEHTGFGERQRNVFQSAGELPPAWINGIQQPHPRMHHPQFSSTLGLACGSSPFNDNLSPVSNSLIHPNWMPRTAHRPYLRDPFRNTNWPAVPPLFTPVNTSDIHFQRECHHHPLPCHMNVYSYCAHPNPCGYSAFPKRPRLEEGKQLIPIETGNTTPVVAARLRSSRTHQELPRGPSRTCRRSDVPPPLVKIVQNGVHQKTSETHSVTETRKKLQSKNTSVTVSKNFSPVQRNGSLKDSNKCRDQIFEVHSTTISESSTIFCKVGPHRCPMNNYELSKSDRDSLPDMKSNTNGKKLEKDDSELKQCNTSAHDKKQWEEFMPMNHVKSVCKENRGRCNEFKLDSYSIRPKESPERLISSKFGGEALGCRKTRDDVQQKCKEQSFAKCREESFASSDQNSKPQFFDGNFKRKQLQSVCQRCNQPEGNPGVPLRKHSVIQYNQTPGLSLTDYKEERPVNTKDNFKESNKPANHERKNHPVTISATLEKCNTEFFKHSQQNQRFATSTGDKIGRCFPISKARNDHKLDDAPNKSQASYLRLAESNVPQLCRGRPRTRGIREKSAVYDGILTCSSTRSQSRLRPAMPCDRTQCNRSTQDDDDDDVFLEKSYIDINDTNTVVSDKHLYQSAASCDHLATNTRGFVNGHQNRRQSTTSDQSEKPISIAELLDKHTDKRITCSCEHCEKTRQVRDNDRGRHQRSSLKHSEEASRDNRQKSSSVSPHEIADVSILRKSQKRERSLEPFNNSSRFVTSLNELMKRRAISSEEHYQLSKFPFDEKRRQDDTQLENKPSKVQNLHWQEESKELVKESCKWDAKLLERRRTPTNPDCSVNERDILRVPNEWAKTQIPYMREDKEMPRRLATVRLSTASCEEAGRRDDKPEGFIRRENQEKQNFNNGKRVALNGQAPDFPRIQPNRPSSREVPLPSAEEETSHVDSGCGGYAIDHRFLPKIVAVHSIGKPDKTLNKDESKLFSASDKQYWNDLLKKLTSEINSGHAESKFQKNSKERTPKVSHTSSLRSLLEESEVPDSHTVPSPKDSDVAFLSNVQSNNSRVAKTGDSGTQWNMWHFLSSTSQSTRGEVTSPLNVVETEEKKTPLLRKKPTVAELSEKILDTRERIKKETIAWKKKLLHSLEAIFIKKLRKTEKETGEKSVISFEEETTKEESKEKKNGQRERRQSQVGKEKMAVPRQKETMKKKL